MAEVRALGVFQERVRSLFGSLLDVLLVEITEAYRESLADSMNMNHCEWCANNRPESRNHTDSKVRGMSGDSQPLMSLQCSDTVIAPEEPETAQNLKILQESPTVLTEECKDIQLAAVEDKMIRIVTMSDNEMHLSPCPAQESPPVLTESSEWEDIQIAVVEDKTIQTTVAMSDNEIQTVPQTPSISEECPPEASGTTEPEPERDVKQEYEEVAVTTEEDEWEIEHACQTSAESIGAQLKPEDNELHKPEESFQMDDSCPHWSPSSLGGYFASVRNQITQSRLVNMASGERLGPLRKQEDFDLSDPPLRPCTVRIRRAEILQRPTRRFHVCNVCNKIFIYKRTLRRHRRFHTGERPHGCSLCSKAFILRKTLRQHTKAHFRRPYSCTQCEKRFKHWRKLRLHWRSHAGESPFVCSRCGKCCKTLKSLDRHLAYVDHDQPTERSIV
ncbi:zinc finger protein 660-like [Labeo rohita]|uniref:Zinc finger protein 660-like n=1 Tax=Labeo rohita TaxID=84645 RepID=A0A498LC67_LABRO|nr:zinc finger protein 660-like [Labeo rohita]